MQLLCGRHLRRALLRRQRLARGLTQQELADRARLSERSISDLIDARASNPVERTAAVVTAEDAMAMLEPGDVLIDSTGSRSLLRDHLVPGSGEVDGGANTLKIRLEFALVITFLYGQKYDWNEYCKYYKNIENAHYKFIPMVNRTHTTAASAT